MAFRITDSTLLTLVSQIYEAALDSSRWPAFLSAFARAVEGRGTVIYTHNFETMGASTEADGNFPNALVGFDPEYMRSLEEHYNQVNVWAQNEALLEPGRPVTGSMLYPERQLPKTEFYQEWLRPQEYFHAIGGIVVRDGPSAMKFSSLRSRSAGDFNSEEIRLYHELLPHLARAAHIQRRFAHLQNLANASFAVLETLPTAILLLDACGRTVRVNAAADRELKRADPLKVSAGGELTTDGPASARAALRTAIAAAVDPVRAVREKLANVARLRRRTGEMLSIQALPFPRAEGVENQAGLARAPGMPACVLLLHSRASPVHPIAPQLLRDVYGLTPAEVQLVMALGEGDTVNGYAERRGISRNTAATQLKRAFDKTGLRRQSELVRWLFQCDAKQAPQEGSSGIRSCPGDLPSAAASQLTDQFARRR